MIARKFVEMVMTLEHMNVMMEIWFREMDVLNTVPLKEATIVVKLEVLELLEVKRQTQ